VTDLFVVHSWLPSAKSRKCLHTHTKIVRHCGHAAFAKDLLEPGNGPRRELSLGEVQINFRVIGSFANAVSEYEVIDHWKQR
jgi:hypothetical protein